MVFVATAACSTVSLLHYLPSFSTICSLASRQVRSTRLFCAANATGHCCTLSCCNWLWCDCVLQVLVGVYFFVAVMGCLLGIKQFEYALLLLPLAVAVLVFHVLVSAQWRMEHDRTLGPACVDEHHATLRLATPHTLAM